MSETITLEICADSVDSAIAAQRGGAHRIELCSNLLEGGVTPSAGLISSVRHKVDIDLYVMIRPRGGDFFYTPAEFEIMKQDVLIAKQAGVDGIVAGILREDGEIDVSRSRCLVEMAGQLKATFHRAFDMSRDLTQSLKDVIETGAHRLLTSGGEQKVEDGIDAIANLVRAADGRISVMAGSGITPANVHSIIKATGVREIHASVRGHVPSPMLYRNEKISMGGLKSREYERSVVLEEEVRRLLASAMGKDEDSAPQVKNLR